MHETRTFQAPWGKLLTGLSIGLPLFLMGVGAIGWALGARSTPVGWLCLGLPPLSVAVAAMFVVRGYEVAPGWLHVLRPGWRTSFPLAGLTEVQSGRSLLNGSLRVFGNGGFLSFTGWFWSKRLGRYRMFVTDFSNPVGLRLSARWVVVSPGDVDGFVEAVRSAARG